MGVLVGFHDVLTRDVGVDFGCAQVGMAKQLFDGSYIGALVEQMGGEAVAEDVRADLVGVRQEGHVVLDRAADIALRKRGAVDSYEKDL